MGIYKFLLKRVLQGLFVIWGIVTVVFLLRFMTPGDPVSFVAPLDAPPALRAQIAEDLGLNQPLHIQYVEYLIGLVQGDMGYSYISNTDAGSRIFARLPATLELALMATLIAIVISIPLGIISAANRHEPSDYAATSFSLVGISTPNFWLGIMLILIFAETLGVLPSGQQAIGLVGALQMLIFDQNVSGLRAWGAHIILPAITLGTYFTALIMRLTRNGMLEELGKTYIRALRAKGLPETLVRYKHALRNTLIPIITILGLQLGTLIGGAVVTETVFAWPGLGRLVITSVLNRDWPLIQGTLIVIGVGFVVINIVVDSLYAYVNPKVGYE